MCDISYSNKQSAHVETDRTAYYILNWLQIYPTQGHDQKSHFRKNPDMCDDGVLNEQTDKHSMFCGSSLSLCLCAV